MEKLWNDGGSKVENARHKLPMKVNLLYNVKESI